MPVETQVNAMDKDQQWLRYRIGLSVWKKQVQPLCW